MRILVLTGIFHPEPGGPATYLHHFLPELLACGHEVTLLTFGDAPTEGYPYPVTRISRHLSYPRRQWAYYRAAARLWSGHDVAFVNSLNVPIPARIRSRVLKVVGDPAWERASNRGWIGPAVDVDTFQQGRYSLMVEINKWQRAQVARRADHVIVPSNYLREMIGGWGCDSARLTTIYNAVRDTLPPPEASQTEARSALGLAEGPLLLAAARLTRWKGIDRLMEALARLEGIRLVVAGEGPERDALEGLRDSLGLGERVQFAGLVPRERMALYYRAADFFALYSSYEGLSHVLLESLRVGTPVIASAKGGNPEVVQDDLNGLLVPYPDGDALAAAITRAFEPGVRERLAAHAADGLDRFSWPRMVSETVHLLEQVGGSPDVHSGRPA